MTSYVNTWIATTVPAAALDVLLRKCEPRQCDLLCLMHRLSKAADKPFVWYNFVSCRMTDVFCLSMAVSKTVDINLNYNRRGGSRINIVWIMIVLWNFWIYHMGRCYRCSEKGICHSVGIDINPSPMGRIHASVKWNTIGSQLETNRTVDMPLLESVLAYCELDPLQQTSAKFQPKYETFYSRNCIWKCRLRNGGLSVPRKIFKSHSNFVNYSKPLYRMTIGK